MPNFCYQLPIYGFRRCYVIPITALVPAVAVVPFAEWCSYSVIVVANINQQRCIMQRSSSVNAQGLDPKQIIIRLVSWGPWQATLFGICWKFAARGASRHLLLET